MVYNIIFFLIYYIKCFLLLLLFNPCMKKSFFFFNNALHRYYASLKEQSGHRNPIYYIPKFTSYSTNFLPIS